jgi:CSLREA domain-containing protein
MRPQRLAFIFFLSLFFLAPSLQAATITPDVLTDDNTVNGNCTLREAILTANTDVQVDACVPVGPLGTDTIILQGDSYVLDEPGTDEDAGASGDLDITDSQSLTIQGQGMGITIIDANGIDRVLHVQPGAWLLLNDLTIQGGQTGSLPDENDGGPPHRDSGGGLRVSFTTAANTLTNVEVFDNHTGDADQANIDGGFFGNAPMGGGIYVETGFLTLINSRVRENTTGNGFDDGSLPLSLALARGGHGGGIAAFIAQLTLIDSTVDGNIAGQGANDFIGGSPGAGGDGGGIFFDADENIGFNLNITGSTISNNQSGMTGQPASAFGSSGGGLYILRPSETILPFLENLIQNSTIRGNLAGGDVGQAGGIYFEGSDTNQILRLNQVTITNNDADAGIGTGGGIYMPLGTQTLNISNSILAGNLGDNGPDCFASAGLVSLGFNILGNDLGCDEFVDGVNGDQVGTPGSPLDPLLGILQDNGGPTFTHALLKGSPAIDQGGTCTADDQRGISRPQDGDTNGSLICDIGAFEYEPVCGDGIITSNEECDDGVFPPVGGDGCSVICTLEFGHSCSLEPSVCVLTCGNGIHEASEGCDDGNSANGDGCSSTCTVEFGYSCDTSAPNICTQTCGDGDLDPGEACDDGGNANGDGCAANCTVEPGFSCDDSEPSQCTPTCGDGTLDAGEECDDNNNSNDDGCSEFCRLECGDGVTQGSEECDDGNRQSLDGCNSFCEEEVCGDGIIQIALGEECEPPSSGSCDDDCLLTACGDGAVQAPEECDDGNNTTGDGCTGICQEEVCGDGIVSSLLGEECDDGNTSAGDGCDDACQNEVVPSCGDGILQGAEECDDGNNIALDGCNGLCETEECGDGIVQPSLGEDCEPPATESCDSECHDIVAPGAVCGNGAQETGEECDDGNLDPGDGCSSACTLADDDDTEEGGGCSLTVNSKATPGVWPLLGGLSFLGVLLLKRKRLVNR